MPRYDVSTPTTGDEFINITSWVWKEYNIHPMKMDAVYGIVDNKAGNTLVGAMMFFNFNGYNVEMNYYGRGVITPGIVKYVAREVLGTSIIRVTIKTEKQAVIDGAAKFGFEHEGIEKNFYGPGRDCTRMVLHHPGIERLAGK